MSDLARLKEKLLANLKPGGVTYLSRDEWILMMANAQDINAERDPLLVEREKTHGSFGSNANVWNRLLRAHDGAGPMKAEQSLALHMIYVKLARILSGNVNTKDHWDDIAGYAKLGAEACE